MTDRSGSGLRLVVKATAGQDDPERCSQAFTDAAVAATAGVDVSLWLAGEAAWFSLPGRAESFALPHSAPLAGLRDDVLRQGSVTVCTQCAARRGIGEPDVLEGVRFAGAATFIAEVMRAGSQALVY